MAKTRKSARSLQRYRAKRNFSRTPEPVARRKKAAPARRRRRGLIFCVQKHLATRLHYDFRLEHRGVLLSWAVPKGPSLNPNHKRLAMRVEDHPLDYADFEGVIPEGYGMGIVLLWDKGTWTPLDEDLDAALEKGHLRFELKGVKLKGEWSLVRIGGRGKSSSEGDNGQVRERWLLIKKRDDWATDEDITLLAPKSVKSKLDFEGIVRKKKPAIWKSNRASAADPSQSLKTIMRRLQKLRARESA